MKKPQNSPEEIHSTISKTVDKTLFIFSIMGVIAQIFSTFRVFQFSITPSYYIQLIATSLLIAITLYKKMISLKAKVITFAFAIMLVFGGGIYSFGFLASAKICAPMVPLFLSFILPKRITTLTIIAFTIIFAVYSFLYPLGILSYSFNIEEYVSTGLVWGIDLIIISLLSFAMMNVSYWFKNSLYKHSQTINKQNAEISEHENRYKLLFETANDAIFILKERAIVDINNKALDLLKYQREEIIGKSPVDFSPALQPDGTPSTKAVELIVEKLIKEKALTFEWENIDSEGKSFFVSINLSTIPTKEGVLVQAIARDITKQKRQQEELLKYRKGLEVAVKERTKKLQESYEELKLQKATIHEQNEVLEQTVDELKQAQIQLVQSEKMASLGVLTAGVAHEINNPLNFIMGGYNGLHALFDEKNMNDEDTETLMKCIKTGIERSTEIVKSLSAFSRMPDDSSENCNIHFIIDNCLLILNNQLKNRISINKEYNAVGGTLLGNSGKLHQVFINILSNAGQAIEGKGEISIASEKNDQYISITIQDTGCGIEPHAISKITEPFYTTKPAGKGTGLGLSITKRIIDEHNGKIQFSSNVGEGTKVEILLPFPTTVSSN